MKDLEAGKTHTFLFFISKAFLLTSETYHWHRSLVFSTSNQNFRTFEASSETFFFAYGASVRVCVLARTRM